MQWSDMYSQQVLPCYLHDANHYTCPASVHGIFLPEWLGIEAHTLDAGLQADEMHVK